MIKICEIMDDLNKLEEDITRVRAKKPNVCSKDTIVELNYFEDILPLLANTERLKNVILRQSVEIYR